MQLSKFTVVLLSALTLSHVFYAPASAAPFFLDDFNDGDHTDGIPALWSPGGAPDGNRSVVDGRLVHSSDGVKNMSTYANECLGDEQCHFGDVSLRTSFQVEGGRHTYVTLFARSTGSPNATLYGGIDSGLRPVLAMSIGTQVTILDTDRSVSLDPTEQELSLQFDVDGDDMALWMWPTGTPQPEAPNATATIPSKFPNETGTVGFFYNPSASTSASFDFFEATAIPEPSSAILTSLACVGVVIALRRRG